MDVLERARLLLEELIEIMEREGENNCIQGVYAVWGAIYRSDFAGAGQNYRSVVQIKDGFSSFYIQRDNFDEMMKANRRLDEIRKELAELFAR